MSDASAVVVAGLTVSTANASLTDSALFVRDLSGSSTNATGGSAGGAWRKLPQPMSMDEDSMPKDRMALLADPDNPTRVYVAGNAGALAWRVDIATGKWEKLWDADTSDGSAPHGDCRNYAWDAARGRLVLTSDGGVFAREKPREAGGKWVSLNGDIKQMEYLSAQYDNRLDRFVGGAQDNSAQIFPAHSTAGSVAVGFVGGDGTVTLVDNVADPSRLFGTTQFLGVGTIDIDPSASVDGAAGRRVRRRGSRKQGGGDGPGNGDDDDGDDDDFDCGGLCFVQGENFIEVPIDTYFPEPSSFPFFVQPYALNSQDPSQLVFWANGTATRPR
jgi:hypothetical protein